jgi:ectoine hydroxylase-related dioxygenase (phytanoyl-CoA dioxygenase family)
MSVSKTQATTLSPSDLEFYQRTGYSVVEGLLQGNEVDALRNRVREYTHLGRPATHLKIQIEPRVERGELKVDHPGDGIRKIDGLVENDDLFRKLGTHPNIVSIVKQILGPDVKLFRNTVLLKPPGVGSPKGMHQDSPYWPIEPMTLCSCWFALDDATPENGCMGVIPGWHTKGALPHKHTTDDFVMEESDYSMADLVLAPLKAGGGLFFHSLLPHYTAPNLSTKWRRAISLTYMSAKSRYTRGGDGPEYFHISGNSYPGCVR